jgi:hypothetical protein
MTLQLPNYAFGKNILYSRLCSQILRKDSSTEHDELPEDNLLVALGQPLSRA